MRTRWWDDRGGSAIEAALLIAAVAAIMLPTLFLLGRVVGDAFSQPCAEQSSPDSCASTRDGGGSGFRGMGGSSGGGGGGGDTAALESRVSGRVSDPGGGSTTARCDPQSTPTPPRGTRAICRVTFSSDGQTRNYEVVWTDDNGTFDVRDS